MTVRTWLTISAVLVVALFAAVALRLAAPPGPPAIVARVGNIRLKPTESGSCWAQGPEKKQCAHHTTRNAEAVTIPRKGKLRVVVAYPAQPPDGAIEVHQGAKLVLSAGWGENIPYELGPGRYQLTTSAKYPKGIRLDYVFAFRVR